MQRQPRRNRAHRGERRRKTEGVAPCRGFTLFEMLLVLGLLVVLAGLAVPLWEGSFTSVHLHRATDQVLATWTRTRTAAIESGQVHQFRFRPDTGDYRTEPWPADPESPVSLAAEQAEDRADADEPSALPKIDVVETDGTTVIQARLPEQIVFTGGWQALDDELGGTDNLRTIQTLQGSVMEDWSEPILFFPDGTTTDASLLLRSERKQYQRATLRGLTGIGRASDILTESERMGNQ